MGFWVGFLEGRRRRIEGAVLWSALCGDPRHPALRGVHRPG